MRHYQLGRLHRHGSRVNRVRFGAHREPLNVRFAPKATELLCRREMSQRADSVEKVCLRTRRNFLRAVGAVFRERRGGPHGARPSQSKTPVADLRRQTDEIEDRIVSQAKFLERSTSDFFNKIGLGADIAWVFVLDRSVAFDPVLTPRGRSWRTAM